MFGVNAALLDALVLAVVDKGDTYGYEITRALKKSLGVSESTLYPVLRRLQKDGCLEIYDKECNGRNRRYYRITGSGKSQLINYKEEWHRHSSVISNLFDGVVQND